MNLILLIVFFLLVILIGGKRGVKSFFSLILNFIILVFSFYLMAMGFNSIIVSLISCIIFSYIILFLINDKNIKTITSFKSILVVLATMLLFIVIFTHISRIYGFGVESFEEINMFSYSINYSMKNVYVSLVLISLIGSMVDTSISISSSLYEVHLNNPELSKKELYKSGISIGKSILCTTTNTLLFAYLSEFITLIIYFYGLGNSFSYVVNSLVFSSEFIKIIFVNIGSIIVIPLTSLLISRSLKNDK